MKKIVTISLLLILTGCGAITVNNSELEEHTFPNIKSRGSLHVESLGIYQTLNGKQSSIISKESMNKSEYWIKNEIFDRWEDENLITKYSDLNTKSDYIITISGTKDKYTPIPLSVISGLTVGLIPTWVTDTYSLDILFINNHTGKEYPIRVENSSTTIVHVVLAPFIFFSGIGIDNMYNDTSAYIYHEIDKQGGFDY